MTNIWSKKTFSSIHLRFLFPLVQGFFVLFSMIWGRQIKISCPLCMHPIPHSRNNVWCRSFVLQTLPLGQKSHMCCITLTTIGEIQVYCFHLLMLSQEVIEFLKYYFEHPRNRTEVKVFVLHADDTSLILTSQIVP